MGAITRAAANNITTGGVILPAGINDASVASITALAQVSAGDGITLISSQTASGSSSISFTTGIDSSYRTYMFKFINMHPSLDGRFFNFQGSTNGGSSYGVPITSSGILAYHDEADTITALSYDFGLAQSTSYQQLVNDVGFDNDQGCSGTLYLFSPSSNTFVKHFLAVSNGAWSSNLTNNTFVGGYFNTTSAINALNFIYNIGNIDAGTIYMYGIA